jgi:hypothetical protein
MERLNCKLNGNMSIFCTSFLRIKCTLLLDRLLEYHEKISDFVDMRKKYFEMPENSQIWYYNEAKKINFLLISQFSANLYTNG